VKVGNRQAPHLLLVTCAAKQKPHPQRWGFCVSERRFIQLASQHHNTSAYAFFNTLK
jgi:hypothetical protein